MADAFSTGPHAAQSVPDAVLYARMLKSVGARNVGDFPGLYSGDLGEVAFLRIKPTLDVLGKYFDTFLTVACVKTLTVQEHLVNLSEMAHMLFVLYRKNGSKFVPCQNYHNTQAMIRTMVTNVINAMHEKISEYYICLDSDDQLEMLFNILRSLRGGRNFDATEFSERCTDATWVQTIFERRPEISSGYRMVSTGVHGGREEGLATEDHMTPKSFVRDDSASMTGKSRQEDRTRVSLETCDVVKAWQQGAMNTKRFMTTVGFEKAELDFAHLASEGFTTLRPKGDDVGVSTAAAGDALPSPPSAASGTCRIDDRTLGEELCLEDELDNAPPLTPDELNLPSRYVKIDGKDVNIDRAISDVLNGFTMKKSTDRGRRVMNTTKGSNADVVSVSCNTDIREGAVHAEIDPLVVLVACEFQGTSVVSAALVIPKCFRNAKGETVSVISDVELCSPGSQVEGRVLGLTCTVPLNDTPQHVTWHPDSLGEIIKSDGILASAVNPDLIRFEDGQVGYTIVLAELIMLMELLFAKQNDSNPPIGVTSISATSKLLPYTWKGEVLLSVAGAEGTAGIVKARKRRRDGGEPLMTCNVCVGGIPCGQLWGQSQLILHAEYHAIMQTGLVGGQVCGVCRMHRAVQYTKDARDTVGCPAYVITADGKVTKGRKTKFRVDCKEHGQVTFSLKIASKSSASNPVTNHIVVCPMCPTEPVPSCFWSFPGGDAAKPEGITHHWIQHHHPMDMPPPLKLDVELATNEMEKIKAKGSKPQRTRSKRKDKTAAREDASINRPGEETEDHHEDETGSMEEMALSVIGSSSDLNESELDDLLDVFHSDSEEESVPDF